MILNINNFMRHQPITTIMTLARHDYTALHFHSYHTFKHHVSAYIWPATLLATELINLYNSHPLKVVDRVSETQLQVSENCSWIIFSTMTLEFHPSEHRLLFNVEEHFFRVKFRYK